MLQHGLPPLRVRRSQSIERAPLTLRRGSDPVTVHVKPLPTPASATHRHRSYAYGMSDVARSLRRAVRRLGRRTSYSVSRETVQWARWHDGITETDTAVVPRDRAVPCGCHRQGRGGAAHPPGATDSPPSRIIHRELWNARPSVTRLGFPWNSKAERVSRSRRCMEASDARAGTLRRAEHLGADRRGHSRYQRGATCFPGNHERQRHVRTPLPQGCTQLWAASDGGTRSTELCTTVDKLRSALWPAPMAREDAPMRG